MPYLRSLLSLLLFVTSLHFTIAAHTSELETAVVSIEQSPRLYRLDGVVEAVQKTTVSAQISGQVEAILYDIDDYVEKGEVVIRLNDKQPAARLKQAEAALKEAQARLREAEAEHERIKDVFAKEAVSKKAMDAAEASLKAARAKHEAARAGLEQAQENLEYTRIRAPYSGIMTERLIEVGETAQPGQKLISGLSLEDLRINVDVPQSMINAVRDSEVVNIEAPDGSRVPVIKKTVFPYAEAASHTFRVRLDFNGKDVKLFPGMFVKAVFEVGQREVLVVPTTTIVRRSEVSAVYVISDQGKVSMRAIRKGQDLASGQTIVLAGLQQGERVAVDPIAAGQQLKIQNQASN